MDYPSYWIWDKHKVVFIWSGDRVNLKTICPRDSDPKAKVQCHVGEGDVCYVRDALNDIGLEANVTGLNILVRGKVPIEYAWDEDDIFIKVAGYATDKDIKEQRKELAQALTGDVKNARKIPDELVAQMNFRGWEDLDAEAQENIREDFIRMNHEGSQFTQPVETEDDDPEPESKPERVKPAPAKGKAKPVKKQPKVNLDEDDDEDEEPEPEVDPLLAQAEALPSFMKGTEGNRPHVHSPDSVDGGGEATMDEGAMDPRPGGGPDPSTLTADD